MNPISETPAEHVERCRLAMDPIKFAHVLRTREILARWLEEGTFERPRDFRASRAPVLPRDGETRGNRTWCLELFEADRLVAHELRYDFDDALAHLLAHAGAV